MESQVGIGLSRIRADVQALTLQVADGTADLSVEPYAQRRDVFTQNTPGRFRVEPGVLYFGVDGYFIRKVLEIGETVEPECDVGVQAGMAVVEAEVVHVQAGAVESDVTAKPVELHASGLFPQRKVLDPRVQGLVVQDISDRQVDVAYVEAVGRHVDMLQGHAVGPDTLPGQGGFFLVRAVLAQRGDQGRQVGGAVVEPPDGDLAVFDTDAADAGLVGQEQGGGLQVDQDLSQMGEGVAFALDDIDILEDDIVGKGKIDLADVD